MNSLKDSTNTLTDFSATIEEENADVCEDGGEGRARESEEKIRNCLICKTPFPSAWAGERICRRCKSTTAWRSGALG